MAPPPHPQDSASRTSSPLTPISAHRCAHITSSPSQCRHTTNGQPLRASRHVSISLPLLAPMLVTLQQVTGPVFPHLVHHSPLRTFPSSLRICHRQDSRLQKDQDRSLRHETAATATPLRRPDIQRTAHRLLGPHATIMHPPTRITPTRTAPSGG